MTKQEFISRYQGWRKSCRKASIPILTILCLAAIVSFGKDKIFEHGMPVWLDNVCALVFIALLAINAIFTVWFIRSQQRRFGLICPCCGKLLAGQQSSAQIVIATGNCVHCGEHIFNENPAT
jgi:hypothetical protein